MRVRDNDFRAPSIRLHGVTLDLAKTSVDRVNVGFN